MKLRWLLAGLLTLIPLALPAQDDGDDADADTKLATPATEAQIKYQALAKEYDTAIQDYSKAYQKAKTDAERQKVHYPQAETYAERFLTLARENPTDRAAVDALTWIGSHCRQGKELDESLDLLAKDYLNSGGLSRVVQSIGFTRTSRTEPWLRTVLEKSPHHKVQGQAAYNLGRFLNGLVEDARLLNNATNEETARNIEQWRGKDTVQRLKTTTPEKLEQEAVQLFEQVAEKYADVKSFRGTLADAAKAELFEIRNLAIGKVAPDIVGEDVDGKTFKLSEYRGKVVVIDFWGDW